MKKRLGDLLVEHNIITEQELEMALKDQKSADKKRLGDILLESERVTNVDLLNMMALQLEIALIDLETIEVDPVAVKMFPEKLELKYGCIPIKRENEKQILVAMADPLNLEALDDLSRMTKCDIKV